MKIPALFRLTGYLTIILIATNALAIDIYVDTVNGSDQADGLSSKVVEGGSGPVKTIARGIKMVKAGDTLHLAKQTYHETLGLNDVAGEPGKPIIIDGNGATLTGCDPLRTAGWEEISPGLYSNSNFLAELEEANDAAKIQRMFFLIDGKMQNMGRTSKGRKNPFKKPEELQPGEWTVDEKSKTVYLKVTGKLAEADIQAPYRRNGVVIRGRKGVSHLIIKNLTCIHVLNDGFNLHGKCNDVIFENIAAYENGDDGYSAHDNCESTVKGFTAKRNSTGIANINLTVTKCSDILLEDNLAFEFLAGYGSIWEIRNMKIIANCTLPFFVGYGRPEKDGPCRVTMENVTVLLLARNGLKLYLEKYTFLTAKKVTSVGLSWQIKGTAKISDSTICGLGLECDKDGTWQGENNHYFLSNLIFQGRDFKPADFADYQKLSKTDLNSTYLPFNKTEAGKLLESAMNNSTDLTE